jgi:hypothetical protein
MPAKSASATVVRRPKARTALQTRMSDANEAQLWAPLASTAGSAFDFWNQFLNLQKASQPLDQAGISAFKCIIRAVSWVESKHGSAGSSANQPSRDPIQCGNPNDAWWTELIDPDGKTDRFVGGPGKSNYYAGELPAAAVSDPLFPADAALSKLSNEADGHNDSNFTPTISFYWGVPFLIHKINTTAGDKTFQCGDVSRDRLVDGAVAYNGGGDPNYKQKIVDALDTIGCLSLLQPSAKHFPTPATVADVNAATETTLARIIDILKATSEPPPSGKRFFFPDGIDRINLQVKVGAVEVALDISGTKQ